MANLENQEFQERRDKRVKVLKVMRVTLDQKEIKVHEVMMDFLVKKGQLDIVRKILYNLLKDLKEVLGQKVTKATQGETEKEAIKEIKAAKGLEDLLDKTDHQDLLAEEVYQGLEEKKVKSDQWDSQENRVEMEHKVFQD